MSTSTVLEDARQVAERILASMARSSGDSKIKPVTQWFNSRQRPVHEGVYEREYSGEIGYSLYLNGFWRTNADTAYEAYRRLRISSWQDLPWRGLAEKPE
jgi:hypothetical protein